MTLPRSNLSKKHLKSCEQFEQEKLVSRWISSERGWMKLVHGVVWGAFFRVQQLRIILRRGIRERRNSGGGRWRRWEGVLVLRYLEAPREACGSHGRA